MGLTTVVEALVADPFSIGAVGLIVILLIAGFLALRYNADRIHSEIDLVRSKFDEVLQEAVVGTLPDRKVSPLLRALTFSRARCETAGHNLWCADADVWRTIERNAVTQLDGEHPLSRLFCGAARHLTGLALVATFVLIGIVLARDVPDAIGAPIPADGVINSSNAALRHAVQLIGSKFLISALGLLLSLVYSGLESRAAANVSAAIHSLHRDFAYRFTTREELQTEAVVGAITRLEVPLGILHRAQQSLESLDVRASAAPASIATSVQVALEPLLKACFVDAVHNLKRHHSNENDETIAALEKSERAIVAGLAEVRDTVKKQAKSDLEALLKQLRDVVNTGYDEEAGRLRSALADLTGALPTLYERLRQLIADVDGALGRQSAQVIEREMALGERIATSLSNVADEASRLRSALGDLTGPIPLLEERLRQLIADVGGDLGRQAALTIEREVAMGERIATSLSNVAGQLEGVSERAEGYAKLAEKMLNEVVALSAAHIEAFEKTLTERAARSVAYVATLGENAALAANEVVAKAMESRFNAIEKKFQEEFSAGLGSISKTFESTARESLEATAATLKQAISDMTAAVALMQQTHQDAARSLNEASSQLVAVSVPSAAVAQENQALQAAAKQTIAEFRAAAVTLNSTLTQASVLETKALETRRQFVEEVIPRSVEKHRLEIEASVAQHQRQMLQLVERVEKATHVAGERIAGQVARLADVIESYDSEGDDDEAQPAAATPPATTP